MRNIHQIYPITRSDADGLSSMTPFWFITVIRLPLVTSFSHFFMKSLNELQLPEFPANIIDGIDTKEILVITDCLQLSVENSKSNYVKNMQAILKETDVNYLKHIYPGDWVFAWMLSDATQGKYVLDKVKRGEPANKFADGLKFVGRVASIRASISQDTSSGNRTLIYSLQAVAFRELSTMVYYNPNLSESAGGAGAAGVWLAKLNMDISDIFGITVRDGFKDNSDLLIMSFLELFVGAGISSSFSNPTGQKELQIATGSQANYSYIIPKEVSKLLGVTPEDKSKNSATCYADILDVLTGIQDYKESNVFSMPKLVDIEKMYNEEEAPTFEPGMLGDPFGPKTEEESLAEIETSKRIESFYKNKERRNKLYKRKQHKFTGKHIKGSYLPLMPAFTNKPLWSLFGEFLNATINEMYTCLRTNENFDIVPTLVIRQKPLSTDDYAAGMEIMEITPYTSLPRWFLMNGMVTGLDLGRSDATRVNFIQVTGNTPSCIGAESTTTQLVLNPPIRDDLDIARNGLRSMVQQVTCAPNDTVNKVPTEWMNLIGDFIIGDNLTLNGVINCYGIQEPICEGDNVEWDGVLFHIEEVKHICSRDMQGNLMFRTTLSVSRGMIPAPDLTSDSSGLYVGLSGDGLENTKPSNSTELDPDLKVTRFGKDI